jgi:hypothetical protein
MQSYPNNVIGAGQLRADQNERAPGIDQFRGWPSLALR